MIPLSPDTLRGSYPPLVTPFRNGAVDTDAFCHLVARQAEAGSHGVVVCGTSGEPSTLTIDERVMLVRAAVPAAGDRLPIVAAVGAQSHTETVTLLECAERDRAAALLIVTPYFVRPSARGLVEYYADLARRTSLPVLLYHIPARTGVDLSPETVERIVARAPNVVGIKYAANDLGAVTEILRRLGSDFRVFAGLEELSFPMLAVGASGLMNAVGNIAPRAIADLCECVARGDLATARRLHFDLFELNRAVFFDTNPIPIKYMLKRMGLLTSNEHRLPMVSADDDLAQRLDGVLRRAQLI